MLKNLKRAIGIGCVLYSAHESAKLTDLHSSSRKRIQSALCLLSAALVVGGGVFGFFSLIFFLMDGIGPLLRQDPNWPVKPAALLSFPICAIGFFIGMYLWYFASTYYIDWEDESKVVYEKKIGNTKYQLRK